MPMSLPELLQTVLELIYRRSQGCGLGLETVSRPTNVSSQSRLKENNVNVSVSSRSRPFTSRAQDQFSAKLCRPRTQYERALDVVSLCYSIAHLYIIIRKVSS